jgi:hypothetical protein
LQALLHYILGTEEEDMCITEKLHLSSEILSYLIEHKDAQDTLEGIAEWWLLEQSIKIRTSEVKAALEDLVNKKLVLEHKGKDSRTHYRINRRKYREIAALVK